MSKVSKKVIVFDLDETIGHFEEVSIFLSGLQSIMGKSKIPDKYLFKLLNLYPIFFRTGIMDVFKTLIREKKKNSSLKVVIYTNNMGPRSWTLLIEKYIHKKLKYKLFDKVITGYRPHEKNNLRTTHDKTYSDLVKTTGYDNKDTRFLFIDDQPHPYMIHTHITYLKVYPYIRVIPFHQMIDTFIQSKNGNIIPSKDITEFKKYMYQYMTNVASFNKYNIYQSNNIKKDYTQLSIIKKKINVFLNIKKTKKRNTNHHNKTKRAY